MVIEFTRHGKTYTYADHERIGAPPTLQVLFKPCALKPAFLLEIEYVGYDDIRMVHLYKPIREIR